MARKSLLLYGDTDTYKTSAIGMLSKWLYTKTGKPLLYVTADAGTWEPLKNYVEAEMIIPFSLLGLSKPIDVRYMLRKLTDGNFPTALDSLGNMIDTKIAPINPTKVGGIAFEGITSIAELLLRLSAGKKVLQNAAWSETIGDEVFGGLSESHYGAVQEEVINLVIRSQGIPLEVVCWTGHEAQAEEKLSKKPIRGVGVVGAKATPRISKNIGTMIHCTKSLVGYIEDKEKGTKFAKYEPRYYFQSHPDPVFENVIYGAKTRLPADMIPSLLERYKGGYFVPTTERGIDEFMAFEDELAEKVGNPVLKWKQEQDRLRQEQSQAANNQAATEAASKEN